MTKFDVCGYNMSRSFTTEEMDSIQEQAQAGIYERDVMNAIVDRLSYIKEHGATTVSTREDDRLIEIVMKYLKEAPEYDTAAGLCIEVAYRQMRSFLSNLMAKMQVDRQDYEDYQQTAYLEMITRLPEYDSTKNRIPAFVVSYIKGAFFIKKNRESGVTSNSKYNATITKHVVNAKAELIAAGNPNPTCNDIANYINEQDRMYKDVTARQVENALKSLVIQTDMDENIHDNTYSPEAAYMKKYLTENLNTLSFHKDKAVKAMFEIYMDYYVNGAEDEEFYARNTDDKKFRHEKKKLSNDYLKQKMEEKLGGKLSISKINSTRNKMRAELEQKGLGRTYQPKTIVKKTPDDVTMTDRDLDTLRDDIFKAF